MIHDLNALRERYSALQDDELQNLAVGGGLTDQARELLDQELRRRGILDVSGFKEHLDRYDQHVRDKKQQALQRREKRIRLQLQLGYIVAFFVLIMGLYVRFVQQNQKAGVGILVAAVVLFPIVWANAFAQRLLWRFLLRL